MDEIEARVKKLEMDLELYGRGRVQELELEIARLNRTLGYVYNLLEEKIREIEQLRGMEPGISLKTTDIHGNECVTSIYKCGNCGYIGPADRGATLKGATAPWCRRCQKNDKLEPCGGRLNLENGGK